MSKPIISNHNSAAMDLHVHSTCSSDGETTILEYARCAQAIGLREVGFCEHVDFDPRDQDYGYLDAAKYSQEISAARTSAPETILRQGVEVAYQHRREAEIRDWLAIQDWDFVVTSIHIVDYVDGWAIISEPTTTTAYFSTHNQRQAYDVYFQELLLAARSGLGDILGHVDLVKRYGTTHYGRFDADEFEEQLRAVLQAAIENGVGLEINTSGLRQSPGEPYPAPKILNWYHELGGEILTIGSDAHRATDLTAGCAQAMDLARSIGFRAITTFENRRILWLDL